MCLYLPIHLVGLALQSSSEEFKWLAEIQDEYSASKGFQQASGTCVFLLVASFRTSGMWKDNDLLQDMIEGHFKFYKHVNDDPEFAKTFLDLLFERYLGRSKK
jgi:hypothetical protein